MNSRTAARRASRLFLIALFLIVFGIVVWGLQYKLSLYDSPGYPSRPIAQAKLLSPNERKEVARTAPQLCPKVNSESPLLVLVFLVTGVSLETMPLQWLRARRLASQNLPHACDSASNFFYFRPPPSFALAQ
jgi:hypothetical protein